MQPGREIYQINLFFVNFDITVEQGLPKPSSPSSWIHFATLQEPQTPSSSRHDRGQGNDNYEETAFHPPKSEAADKDVRALALECRNHIRGAACPRKKARKTRLAATRFRDRAKLQRKRFRCRACQGNTLYQKSNSCRLAHSLQSRDLVGRIWIPFEATSP